MTSSPAGRKKYQNVTQHHYHHDPDQRQREGGDAAANNVAAAEDALYEEEDSNPVLNTAGGVPSAPTGEQDHRGRRSVYLAVALACLCLGGGAAALAFRTGAIGAGAVPTDHRPPAVPYDDSVRPRDSSGTACLTASTPPSTVTHALPVENSPVSRIAFGSCFIPSRQNSETLWRHVRETFRPDLWIWLGDNMYLDTFTDMDAKRRGYNEAREDRYYKQFGPVAEPKIPVVGIWDDHDFGYDNMGREYPCLASSQAEFVTHFGLPESDPRHPAQGELQRNGVYSSQMFAKPGSNQSPQQEDNGIHVINLDNRSHRSQTYDWSASKQAEAQPYKIPCDGAESTMLGTTQWSWLEDEMLNRQSVIKLIGSGVQVLPPTHRDRPKTEYCSYDGPDGTFDAANVDLGESTADWVGTKYEGWGEMPQERTRLLRLAQRSINTGMASTVVFLTGDQHWSEIQAKRVPDGGDLYGQSRVLFSVTASGIDQHYVEDVGNANRVRVRSADRWGDGVYTAECNFPFIVDGVTYDDCADAFGTGRPGCSTETDADDVHVPNGGWGNCLDPEDELVPRNRSTFGRRNKCTDNYHHTCSARANYGGIVVDWERGTMNLTVWTPHEEDEVASSVEIDI